MADKLPVPFHDDLDPGIRDVVRWLHAKGFRTTDSGDGRSKPGAGRSPAVLGVPHVFLVVELPSMLATEVERLSTLLGARGIYLAGEGPGSAAEADELGVAWVPPAPGTVPGWISGSYSPGGPAVIALFGVDAAVLHGNTR